MLYKVCSLAILAGIGTVAATFVLPGVMVGFCVGRCSREAGHRLDGSRPPADGVHLRLRAGLRCHA